MIGSLFGDEERIGRLASSFAFLAVFISCIGMFGIASFMAGQRSKEIGIRKILGASVFNLWRLLSADFLVLVIISLFVAFPISYYFMDKWLQNYQYHSAVSYWVFVLTGCGAILVTLITVSYQSLKTALIKPIKIIKIK